MKNSLKICMEKVYINNCIHVLFFHKEHCNIIGIVTNKKMNFMEKVSLKKRKLMKEYAYDECIIDSYFIKSIKHITGNINIKLISLHGNEKVLILKGRTIVAVYQNGVDFIEGLSIEIKKEILSEVYNFGYINADIYARVSNKFESIFEG